MFSRIAGVYDLLNRVLSLGQDGRWRRRAARQVPRDARVVIDLCAGTGDLARAVVTEGRLVLACDASEAMLRRGARRRGRRDGGVPCPVAADAYRLPLADATADAVTIAFGLRNLHETETALAEMRRVLRPGGSLVILELAPPGGGVRGTVHRLFVRHVVPTLALLCTRDRGAYRYLSRSVLAYLDETRLASALRAAGLTFVSSDRLGGGAVQLLMAERA